MKSFYEPLKELAAFTEAREHLNKKKGVVAINGCVPGQIAHFIAALGEGRHKVILTYSEMKARELAEDLKLFCPETLYYPAKDFIFYQADVHGNRILQERLRVLRRLAENLPITVVMTFDALMDKLLAPERFRSSCRTFRIGDILDLDECRRHLTEMGYEAATQAELPGQFAIRGSIIDIFPLTEETPYRIDLFDDEIDLIKAYDAESQRSIENVESFTLYPATEYVFTAQEWDAGCEAVRKEAERCEARFRSEHKSEEAYRIKTGYEESLRERNVDSYIDYFTDETVSLLSYFPKDETMFFVDEPNRVKELCDCVEAEFGDSMKNRLEKGYVLPGQMNVLIPSAVLFESLSERHTAVFQTLEQKCGWLAATESFYIESRNISSYRNDFEMLSQDLLKYRQKGYRVILVSSSRTRAKRLAENLMDYEISAFYSEAQDRELSAREIMTTCGRVSKGFEYPSIKFAVISETDIFTREKRKTKPKSPYSGKMIQSLTELTVGDYVVHETHGLGIYRGIEKVSVDGVEKDYIKVSYDGGSSLYVQVSQLDKLQKYAEGNGKEFKLNKLGGQEWNKTKTRVKSAVKDIAKELVALYSARQNQEGFAYTPDTLWQKEFEEMFPYEETGDQLQAIAEMKEDMESKKIMDRLVCGDVGFGKTEVAIRGAFKAVQDGKQVAVLVPTTILAQQHYNNFVQRFKDFPVRVDLMSRFRSSAQQKKTLTDLKKGFVDILIGTHRILSKDVVFKDLGLLVIDEEQRFGVTHKEKIKQLRQNVDVLTLSATPIPRTLHMSLVGIRDMSVLEEAPVDRLPIQTYVMEFSDEMVREAINRELARGGQVYYVYNRVKSIDEVTQKVQELVPEANVVCAHGQMGERMLEQIMYDFINGDIDVLVSTTIIETGMDIPNANTMIVQDADRFGLSQLYQLRGRIGRSTRTSYAFLMYRRDKLLREEAEKRLAAIREFTELGSGIKIALRDLELRGAGNVLGAEQHGHMEAVGYDLYCKMLNEAVLVEKGEHVEGEEFDTVIDLPVDAFIPDYYIKNESVKLELYKRIAALETEEERDDMEEELTDRFGDVPKTVENLLAVGLLKARAHGAYITEMKGNRLELRIGMYPKGRLRVEEIPGLIRSYRGRLIFKNEAVPYFLLRENRNDKSKQGVLEMATAFVADLEKLVTR